MENHKDVEGIKYQIRELKGSNEKALECLSAIELLMVDDNNGKIKASNVGDDIHSISVKLRQLSGDIDRLSTKL